MRVASAIALPIETRRQLEKQIRGRSTSVRVAQRSRIVLLAADGLQNKQIAEQMGHAEDGRFLARSLYRTRRRWPLEGCSETGPDADDFSHHRF